MPDVPPGAKVSPAVWHHLSHPGLAPLPARDWQRRGQSWHRPRAGTGWSWKPGLPSCACAMQRSPPWPPVLSVPLLASQNCPG